MAELLEREDLLAQLETARKEGGRLVFVGGEAGVGKTSLVAAFAARVERVLQGACDNLTTPTPLGPFLDVEDVASAGEPKLVAAILRKREVRTRGEVAAAASRLGLIEDRYVSGPT